MINLIWSEIRQVSVEEDTLYSALLYIYRTYIGSEDDSIDEIIEGIQDNIENYIEELIEEASPYDYSNGDKFLGGLSRPLWRIYSRRT